MYVVTFSDLTEIGVNIRRIKGRSGIWEAKLSSGQTFSMALRGRNDAGSLVVCIDGVDTIVSIDILFDGRTQLSIEPASPNQDAAAPAIVEQVRVSRAAEVVFLQQELATPDNALDTTKPPPFTSPITGILLDVFVSVGQQLKKGDPILLIEAMKMENTMLATTDCTVSHVHVKPNDTVFVGDKLVSFS